MDLLEHVHDNTQDLLSEPFNFRQKLETVIDRIK